MTVCDCVAETALTGERVYPNNKDLTGTIQLDIDKQLKICKIKTSKKKNFFIVLGSSKQALGGEWSHPFCSGPQVRSLKGPKPVVLRGSERELP